MNAENALKERQSRFVCGFAKLKAKIIKIAELMMTSDQSPYAGASSIFYLPWKPVENLLGMVLMLAVPATMTSVASVKQMQERAEQQQNIR
jgi:hypothetical protein